MPEKQGNAGYAKFWVIQWVSGNPVFNFLGQPITLKIFIRSSAAAQRGRTRAAATLTRKLRLAASLRKEACGSCGHATGIRNPSRPACNLTGLHRMSRPSNPTIAAKRKD